MAKRGLDPISAWLISLVVSLGIFGGALLALKSAAKHADRGHGEASEEAAAAHGEHEARDGEKAEGEAHETKTREGEAHEAKHSEEKAEPEAHEGKHEEGEKAEGEALEGKREGGAHEAKVHEGKAHEGGKAKGEAHEGKKHEGETAEGEEPEGEKAHPAKAAKHEDEALAHDGKSGGPEPHWDYKGSTGPDAWSELGSGYKLCGNGKRQSPVDIDAPVTDGKLLPLRFNYKQADVKVKNNGHTVEVAFPLGNYVDIDGERFDLIQFHFHTPSEHKVAGIPYEFEAHLVHKNAEGQLAVVSVLFEEGAAMKSLDRLWALIPEERGEAAEAVEFDPTLLLPKRRIFYSYPGSLTTPPCSEGVNWYVLAAPMTLSAKQIDAFVRIFGNNARPVQTLKGRKVRKSSR